MEIREQEIRITSGQLEKPTQGCRATAYGLGGDSTGGKEEAGWKTKKDIQPGRQSGVDKRRILRQ